MTRATRKAAIGLYRAGLSLAAVGREVGCSGETVRQVLRQAGEPIRPQGSRSEPSRPEWWAEAARRYQEGASLAKVALAVKRDSSSVHNALVRLGVPRREAAATRALWDTEHMRALGRKGGSTTAGRHGHDHYVAMGKRGGQRMKALLALGRALEKEERDGRD